MLSAFFTSVAIGFMISAPMGPVGAMCLRQCLYNGPIMGVLAGFSCALADGIYAAVAAFGFADISTYLFSHLLSIQIVGIIYLTINGVILLRKSPTTPSAQKINLISNTHKFKQLINIFLATVINPVTIVAIPTILATIGLLDHALNFHEASLIVAGIIAGTTCWWIIVALLVANQRQKVNKSLMKRINKVTGLILLGCALLALIHVANL